MYDQISLGPTPYEEPCQQVGSPDYSEIEAKKECRRFIDLLREKFGDEPAGAKLKITRNPHDFGDYFEVVVEYDGYSKEAVEYACLLESKLPGRWEDGE
jgi:hypothetical protein